MLIALIACPNEKLYFIDNTVYILYKSNDDTYPDIGRMTTKYYNKHMIECYWGTDTMDGLGTFSRFNFKEEDNLVKFVEELAILQDIEENKIEEIFQRYKNALHPVCELYKLCYYLPTLFYALDIRMYKGKPTRINRSFMMPGIINFLKGKMTKDEALHIWNNIAGELEQGETVERFTCTIVEKHQRELKSDRFTNKQGKTIPVDDHPRITKKKAKTDYIC